MRVLILSLLALVLILSAFGCGKKDDDAAATGSRVAVQSADARSGIAAGDPGGAAAPPEAGGDAAGTVPAGEEQPVETPGADGAPGSEAPSLAKGAPMPQMSKADAAEAAKKMLEGMKVEGDEKSGKVTMQSPGGPMSITYKNTVDSKITASSVGLAVPSNSKRVKGFRTAVTIPMGMPGMPGGAAPGAKSPAKPTTGTITREIAVYQCSTGVEETKEFFKTKFGKDLMDLSSMAATMQQGGQKGLEAMMPGAGKLVPEFKPEGMYMLMKDGKIRQIVLGPAKGSGATMVLLLYIADMPQAMMGMGGGMGGGPAKGPSQ